MNSTRLPLFAGIAFVVCAQSALAQDLSRYRAYALESSVASVIGASGGRASSPKTLHERPAKIQELEWRAPYASSNSAAADPVREVAFTFWNDALYQVVVTYDRGRTDGLTSSDIIESLSAVYGVPLLKSARSRPTAAPLDTVIVAQWDSPASSLTLLRDAYAPEFQLVLVSKALNTRARTAIREAIRLDAIEAPRREAEQRKREIADAAADRDKARTTNKAAFHP